MTFSECLEMANYLNVAWRGFFTEKEIKENARDYYIELKENKTDSDIIKALLEGLKEDIENGNKESEKWYNKLVS